MKSQLEKLTQHSLLKTTLCLIEKKYGKQQARQAEIYLTNNFIMEFSTKALSQPWTFASKQDCQYNVKEGNYRDYKKNKIRKIEMSKNTNLKYPNFIQTIFTAGDREQFEQYGIDKLKGDISDTTMNKIETTFEYIFTYLKKGIFVEIYNNKISVFLPFNNANFKNVWSKNLKVDTKYRPGEITKQLLNRNDVSRQAQLQTQLKTVEKYKNEDYSSVAIQAFETFPRREIIKDTSKWYANNCIFRNGLRTNIIDEFGIPTGKDEFGGPAGEIDEGDKTAANFLELLATVCLHKKVKDSVFFMNYRDFPYVSTNLKNQLIHPYDSLFLPAKSPPLIYLNNKPVKLDELVPIFSQSVTNKNKDILFIDEDEIEEKLPVVTKPTCRDYSATSTILWKNKKPIAVFRGSMTGCGTEIWNPRVQIAAISEILQQIKFKPTLDAKLTNLKKRFKKDPLKEFVDYNNPSKLVDPKLFEPKINLKPFYTSRLAGKSLSEAEQKLHKYIIMVEGFVSPFRLSNQLSWGSLIIMVPSKWKLWFETENCAIPAIKFGTINQQGELVENVDEIQGLQLQTIKRNCKSGSSKSLLIGGNKKPKNKCPNVDIIDIKNLKATLKWCQKNDTLAEQIANQGRLYYEMYLNRNKMLDYVACKINEI